MRRNRLIGKWLLGLWSALLLMACGDDLPGDERQRMEIRVRLGTADATTRSIGDPGTDHGEWTAEVDSIALFLVYEDKSVIIKKFLASNLTETDGVYTIPLMVKSGTVDAYAVAYRSPQGFDETHFSEVENIRNMKSLDLDNFDLFGQDLTDGSGGKTATAQEYMRNLFSGSRSGIAIPLDKSVTIQLDRQIAKVDVQWDVQDAYDTASGKYTEVGMSEITFYGMTYCYLFPDKKINDETPAPSLVTTGAYTCSSAISQRNGRAYFYTFPEEESTATTTEKVKFEFTLTYKTGESTSQKKEYTATFSDLLEADVWYKVNINVKGMSTSTNDEITLSIP